MLKKNTILKFEIISTIIIMVLGTLLHFVYDWTNNNVIVGVISPVNESVWEHLKLLFYPMLLMLIVGYCYKGKNIPNYVCSKVIGIIVSVLFTVIFHYTYSGIIGESIELVDIGSFFVAVLLGQYISYKKMKSSYDCNKTLSIAILLIMFICFTVFTFFPPRINLFKDPIENLYGTKSSAK